MTLSPNGSGPESSGGSFGVALGALRDIANDMPGVRAVHKRTEMRKRAKETLSELCASPESPGVPQEDPKTALASSPKSDGWGDIGTGEVECHGLDTAGRVCFYEQDFYVLSNFSAFEVEWAGIYRFKTAEHCYHWLRFATGAVNGKLGGATPTTDAKTVSLLVMRATSAHDAFKIAQDNKHLQRADWNDVKVSFMKKVIRAKADQHEYVRRKLLATGDRELVENSWRDDFWGWGPNGDGQNMLGKLWMEVRAELLPAPPRSPTDTGRVEP